MIDLPALPEGYFFRIRPGYVLGMPCVWVSLRRRWSLGPLRWSTLEDKGWTTRELMKTSTDRTAAALLAREQAVRLARRRRRIDLEDLA